MTRNIDKIREITKPIENDEEDRNKATQVRLAAIQALEQEGYDYDEASSETRGSPSNAPPVSEIGGMLPVGMSMRTIGDFEVEDDEYEEAQEEFAQQSPEAKRVDKRRRAPITTNEDVYAQAPGRYDFPGVDTPTQDPKALPKDYKAGDPRTTEVDEESEVATSNPGGFDMFPEAAAGSSLEDSFMAEMAGRDVPASPEEVQDGVGAGGMTALGGLHPSFGETRPGEEIKGSKVGAGQPEPQATLENVRPPETALQAQSRGEVADAPDPDPEPEPVDEIERVYDEKEPDISYVEFRKRTEKVSQQLGLTSEFDTLANAKMVAESPDVLDNF